MSIHVNESAVVKEITTSGKGGASWCLAYNPNDTYADLGWTDNNDTTFHNLNTVELPYAPEIMMFFITYNHATNDGRWDGTGTSTYGSGGHGCYIARVESGSSNTVNGLFFITQGHKYKCISSANYPTMYIELIDNLVKITAQKNTASTTKLTTKTALEYIIGHAY